jgi:hypothetical protein
MLEIKKSDLLKVKIYEKEYEIKKPTVRQVQCLQEALKDEDQSRSMKALCSFFVELGLPEDVVLDLELDALTKLGEYVNGSKKN